MSNCFNKQNRSTLVINFTSTSEALTHLKNLIQREVIHPEDFKLAQLSYNAHEGLGECGTPKYFPLKFIGEYMEVWVSSVAAGYRGEGPHGTIEALNLMGFEMDDEMKEVIFTKKVTAEIFNK